MKTEILLYIFFASSTSLVTSVHDNFNSETVTTDIQTLRSNTFDEKLESWKHLFDKKIKKFKNVINGFSIPFNTDKEDVRTKVNFYTKERPPIESEIEYEGMKEENKFRDIPNQFDLSTIQKNRNYLQQLVNNRKRNFYLESYYPKFHQRDHFNDIGQNLYDPRLYPEPYNVRHFDKQLMNRKRHPKFLLENQEHIPQKENFPFYPGGYTPFSKDASLPRASNDNDGPLKSMVKSMVLSAEPANGMPENPFIKPSERSRVGREYIKRTNINIIGSPSGLNEITTRNGNSEYNEFITQEMAEYYNPNADENVILFPHSDDLHFLKKHENASEKNASPFPNLQSRFERESAKDDAKDSHKLLYNRIYFEKIPDNLNLSWFVYAICSRDKCLLKNSTDEIELLNEGWILYNCTYYGCNEIHPRSASIQKFNGLKLIVFSICVLKIIAYLALFYYCRRKKMSKKAPYDPDKWDEEKSRAIPKCKKLGSNIPELEKWKTGNGRKSGNLEVKQEKRSVDRKTPKIAKTSPVSHGDRIILNMDEEENRNGSCMPVKTEKTPLVEYLAKERMQQFYKC